MAGADVGDDVVEATEHRERPLDDVRDRVVPREVAVDREHAVVAGVDRIARGGQRRRVAAGKHHARTFGEQPRRDRPADAARAARDEGDLTGEPEIHRQTAVHPPSTRRSWPVT